MVLDPKTMKPKRPVAAAVATFRLLAEDGGTLTTESGDKLRTE